MTMTITEDSRLQGATLRAELNRRATRERLHHAGMNLNVEAPPALAALKNDDLLRELGHCRDDRKEIEDPAVAAIASRAVAQASAVAAIIPLSRLAQRPDQSWVLNAPVMENFFDLDPSERFRDQPVGAAGAASLISRQLVVTAAHITPTVQILQHVRLVFGYRLDGGVTRMVFSNDHVYQASLFWIDVRRDIALLQLDRPVPEHHAPLVPRTASAVVDGEPLYTIGYPVGLPAKFAGNARVLDNRRRSFFFTDLDVMDGSSGSPVFSATNGDLVGVVSTAPVGFTTINGRLVSDFCHDPNDVPIGVTRITNLPR